MQWNSTKQAGFTSGEPWLEVNENYTSLNVEEQEKRPDSVLNYFREMVQLRKKYLTLVYGEFEIIDKNNEQIFAYTRKSKNEQLLVVLNFSDKQAVLNTQIDVNKNKILISNYKQPNQDKYYLPYAAVIYKMENNLLNNEI